MKTKLRILAIGAHPDDCDIRAGGVAALYADAGHRVKFVSITNGDAGHHEMKGEQLAERRRLEAKRAGAAVGISYDVLDIHDGKLVPSLEHREKVIRVIREFRPDLIMTLRPNDYHPDHRYASQLVQDAAYMVTVPNVVPDTEYLRRNPVIVYFRDSFQKPRPFEPDVVVDIGSVLDRKIEMLHAHTSQFYEWLPFNGGYLNEVPEGDVERKAWLKGRMMGRLSLDDRGRRKATELYGGRADTMRFVEMFEACEYGSALTDENLRELFPFFDET